MTEEEQRIAKLVFIGRGTVKRRIEDRKRELLAAEHGEKFLSLETKEKYEEEIRWCEELLNDEI